MGQKLVITGLNKSYGKKDVLKDVNITFEEGKIYSVIGVNGSGKTTFFNCIDGDLVYEGGKVELEDEDGKRRNLKFDDVGLVLDTPTLPDYLTGYEFLYFFAMLHGEDDEKVVASYFDMVQINEEDRHRLIRDYSFGMKNKIQLLCCLVRKPKVILLDEPLSSFDIIVSHQIKEALKKMKGEHIIVMSTHIMQLAQDISDEIVLLRDKKMQLMSDVDIHSSEFEQYIIDELTE
ncbi:MAG: ABC transporter ATP-binding protein [Lachnospiraceae bacterium]|nr:ABC transporter ATP-binding protein [Lachnospiraceae bacterium]